MKFDFLKIGVKVRHTAKHEWGDGKVKSLDDSFVEIYFDNVGMKKLKYKGADSPQYEFLIEGGWQPSINKKFVDLLNPCLGFYIRTGSNITAPMDFTNELLDIKRRNENLIKKNANQVLQILKNPIYQKHLKNSIICAVPSSKKENTDTGITRFAQFLLKNYDNFIDGIHLLKRIESIQKNSSSANFAMRATKDDHIRTIEVQRGDLIKNKTIFLIDDIKTTGTTLESCKYMLEKVGASEVIPMSLGETIYESHYKNDLSHPGRKNQSDYFQSKLEYLNQIGIE